MMGRMKKFFGYRDEKIDVVVQSSSSSQKKNEEITKLRIQELETIVAQKNRDIERLKFKVRKIYRVRSGFVGGRTELPNRRFVVDFFFEQKEKHRILIVRFFNRTMLRSQSTASGGYESRRSTPERFQSRFR